MPPVLRQTSTITYTDAHRDETYIHIILPTGHITSLAVLRSYRKMGIATKLMLAASELGGDGERVGPGGRA